MKERTAAVGRRQKAISSAKAVVAHHWPKASQASGKTEKKHSSTAAQKKIDSDRKRWYAELQSDAEAIMMRDKPTAGAIWSDVANGRFKCSYPGQNVKSFSWTRRGSADAVREALAQMWQWHTAATGEPAPSHLVLNAVESE